MCDINCKEFFEIKQAIKKLEKLVYIPEYISLSDIADDLNISRQTLTYHIKTSYDETKYKLKKGRIYINVSVLPQIKAKYEKK